MSDDGNGAICSALNSETADMQPPKRRLEPPQLHVISWEKHSARFSWEKEEEDLDGWLVTFKLEIASSPDFKDFKLRYTGDENECEVRSRSNGCRPIIGHDRA